MHILGIKLDDSFVVLPNQNESLDLIGFELLTRINKCFDKKFAWRPNGLFNFIPVYLIYDRFTSKDPSLKFMPKKEIYESYITYFEESNEWVRKEFFPHKERLFPKKDLKDLSTYK